MNKENQKKLRDRFEFMVPKKTEGPQYAYPLFGIECGDGWFDLLWKLCEGIEKQLKKDKIKDFEVNQIKEKFAGLRFYVAGCNNKIRKLIDKAEEKSCKICEECGEKGKRVHIRGWYLTLCDECEEAEKARRLV